MDMKVYPGPSGDEKHDGVMPPPPPPVVIRTMGSDVKSVQESGGGKPEGEILNPPRPPIRPEPPKLPREEGGVKIKVPGYVGPEKPVFSPESLPAGKIEITEESGGSKKTLNVAIVAIVIAAAVLIGASLYFYAYPLLLGDSTTPTTPPPSEAPSPEPAPPPPSAHVSLVQADATEDASSLSAVSPATITDGGTFVKEVVLKRNNSNLSLAAYLPELISELDAETLKNNFEDDFTAFIYYDETGAWPGYVIKRRSEATQIIAQNAFRKIESSASLKNLFLSDPGNSKNEFKTGEYNGIGTRYLVYESQGAAINYAWVNDSLILVTHFPALQSLIDSRLVR